MTTPATIRVLLIEDDPVDVEAVLRFVRGGELPFSVTVATSIAEGRSRLATVDDYDAIIADYRLGDGTIMELAAYFDRLPAIIVTGAGDEATAVAAIKAGAADYLMKDPQQAHLRLLAVTVENAIAHRQTRVTNRLLTAAIRATTDCVYITDSDDRIIFVNNAFCHFYGYPRETAIGRHADLIRSVPGKSIPVGSAGEVTHRRRDGSTVSVVLTRSDLEPETGSEHRQTVVNVAHDISPLKASERALAAAKDKAEAANRAKTEFLANVSHEIRTPMNAIVGMAELLVHTSLNADQHQLLRVVRSSADSLMSILDDVLDLSKIEAGKLSLHAVTFDLEHAICSAAEMFSQQVEARDLPLVVDLDPAAPRLVYGDDMRLRQVLVNLIGNAVKFTESGHILVRLDHERLDDTQSRLLFRVEDTGMGIPDYARERLFQPFSQADNTATRSHGGSGLGLVISQRLLALMGGHIDYESELGIGTCMSFDIPVRHTADTPPILAELAPPECRDVCLITSLAPRREAMRRALAALGHRVRCHPTVAAALAVDHTGTTVWVVDEPSDADLHRIATSPTAQHDRVLALTQIGVQTQADSLNMEFAAKLTRPSAFARQIQSDTAAAQARSTAGQPRKLAIHGSAALRVLAVEDNPVNQVVIRQQIAELGMTATIAADGFAAIEAVAAQEYDIVLMDIQLPDMDGYETCRRIRAIEAAHPERRPSKIIAVTAHLLSEERERCKAAGMDEFLSKPVTLASLSGVIVRNMPAAVIDEAVQAEVALLDLDRLAALADLDILRVLLTTFIEDTAILVDRIHEACQRDNFGHAGRVANTLAGVATNIGAVRLYTVAQEMEHLARQGDTVASASVIEALIEIHADTLEAVQEHLRQQTAGSGPLPPAISPPGPSPSA